MVKALRLPLVATEDVARLLGSERNWLFLTLGRLNRIAGDPDYAIRRDTLGHDCP
jgi:hypothetical protein